MYKTQKTKLNWYFGIEFYLASVCKAEEEIQDAVWQTATKCMLQVHLVTFDE